MNRAFVLSLSLFVAAVTACGSETSAAPDAAADAASDNVNDSPSLPFAPNGDAMLSDEDGPDEVGSGDAGAVACVSGDGSPTFDAASRFQGSCSGGCGPATICAVEIGGVAGGRGEYCAPIPDGCRDNPTCACLGACVCGVSFGRPERCTDATGANGVSAIDCDNLIR
jgi:hypothetical protein